MRLSQGVTVPPPRKRRRLTPLVETCAENPGLPSWNVALDAK